MNNIKEGGLIHHMWRKLYWGVRSFRDFKRLTPKQREVKRLMGKDYQSLVLDESTEKIATNLKNKANTIYGESWDYYSGALARENIKAFEEAFSAANPGNGRFKYLEIGSNQGISMSLVGLIAKSVVNDLELISVDPYYEEGYREGQGSIFGTGDKHVNITKNIRDSAFQLYRSIDLDVRLIEKPSTEGLKELVRNYEECNLIYIDGFHEKLQPVIDFGLSSALLQSGGVVMIDDHYWEAVSPIKKLCDKYCMKIYESWKIAVYKVD